MRVLILFLALLLPGQPRAATPPEPLDLASRMIDAGAAALALSRIDALQPGTATEPRWLDWERLRVEALVRLGRGETLLQRARSWPVDLPGPAAGLRLAAARAAIDAGKGTLAREHLRALLWGSDTSTEEHRAARLLVIESHLAAGALDPAYLAMLRFQLDFRPIAPIEAERFVGALLEKDRVAEAIGWLAQLDPDSAEANILRMRAGLMPPDDAVKRAREIVRKAPGSDGWDLLLAAAVQREDLVTEVEARERRLQLAAAAQRKERAAALWQAYAMAGMSLARAEKLEPRDAAAVVARAQEMLARQPIGARALLGLVAGAASGDAGPVALGRVPLVESLGKAGLGLAALRLFADDERFPPAGLDPALRRALGEIAAQTGQDRVALRLLGDLAPPPGTEPADWALKLLPLRLWSGDTEGLGASVARLGAQDKALSSAQRRALGEVADQALQLGEGRGAAALYSLLASGAAGAEREAALEGLAQSRALLGDHLGAADAWLRIALAPGTRETGPGAVMARARAAESLLRGGRIEDAHALYRWVAKHAGTTALREAAERTLARIAKHDPR